MRAAPRALGAALLELLAPSVCPVCNAARAPRLPRLCGRCRVAIRPLRELAGIATVWAYESAGARLVQRFKFEHRRDALEVLLEPLVERARELPLAAGRAGIVPVPRHPAGVRELRADPVHLLGRELARRLPLPLWDAILVRARRTQPQTALTPEARRENVRGSFVLRARLAGCCVLLLDDVVTTGATLGEARRVLLESGRASAVVCLALAGTPPSGRLAL